MTTLSPKDAAVRFLLLATEGKIAEAYDTFTGPDFRHHNAYYKSDAASLRQGMEESHERFPHKVLDVRHVIGDGETVAVHSRVLMQEGGPEMALVHIFRFQGDRIVELWDVGQPVPEDIVNEIGMF